MIFDLFSGPSKRQLLNRISALEADNASMNAALSRVFHRATKYQMMGQTPESVMPEIIHSVTHARGFEPFGNYKPIYKRGEL